MIWFVVELQRMGIETPTLAPAPEKVRVHRAFVRCSVPDCLWVEIRHYGASRTILCWYHRIGPRL